MENKTKRGYLNNFTNYREWFVSHDMKWIREHKVKCCHCGNYFIPNSPNQKYCGPENKACHEARNDSSLANGMWVKNADASLLVPFKFKQK